jgi:sulfonate transport system substrate-binding protein
MLRCRNKRALLVVVFALFLAIGRGAAEDRVETIKLDWAYYNPLSLVLREKGLLEEEFKKDGIKIEWAQSLGSNKALWARQRISGSRAGESGHPTRKSARLSGRPSPGFKS